MPVYFFTGKLGSGKTLCAVGKARDYMGQSRRVASNIDIDVTKFGAKSVSKSAHVVRIPDKPTAMDMATLGYGYGDGTEPYAEEKFGLILLDELGTWFNARSWNDKSRKALIDWCVHARKYRWDVAFIVQDISMVDGQLRDGVCEMLVVCKRADRIKILGITPPKIHVAAVYNASRPDKNAKFDRWIYRGRDLYGAYDTGQVFSAEYDKGVYCPLIEGYFDGYKEESAKQGTSGPKSWRRVVNNPIAAAVFGAGVGASALALAGDQYNPIDIMESSASSAVDGKGIGEIQPPSAKVNWLAGLGKVYFAGTYTDGTGQRLMFDSSVAGVLSGVYFQDAGATIKAINSCAVAIYWPDGETNIVGCDKTALPQRKNKYLKFQDGVSM